MIKEQPARFRKDLGDLTDLKASIKLHGLFNPITVDSKGNLICGARRQAACRELGFEPESRVIDFDNPELAEVDENTCRKDFTTREIYEISKYFTQKYSRQGKRNDLNGNGSGAADNFAQNPNEVKKPTTARKPSQRVARAVGMSADAVSKLNQIYDSEFEPVKKSLDAGEISINEAYIRVKRRKKEAAARAREEEKRAEYRRTYNDPEQVRAREEQARQNEQWWREFEESRKRGGSVGKNTQTKNRVGNATMAKRLIELGYKAMASRDGYHPDKGGTDESMIELTELKELLLANLKRLI